MPDAAAKLQATWAEDRAPVRTDPSADLGAKTEERAAVQQAAARPSHLRDWRQCAKPSRHDAANVPTRRPSKVANDNRPEFHFPLNQHTIQAGALRCGGEEGLDLIAVECLDDCLLNSDGQVVQVPRKMLKNTLSPQRTDECLGRINDVLAVLCFHSLVAPLQHVVTKCRHDFFINPGGIQIACEASEMWNAVGDRLVRPNLDLTALDKGLFPSHVLVTFCSHCSLVVGR